MNEINQFVARWIAENPLIVLPFAVLAVRWLVRLVIRESAKEILRNLRNSPMDLVMICVAFTVRNLGGSNPNFLSNYANATEARIGAGIDLVGFAFVACFVGLCDRWSEVYLQKIFSAMSQISGIMNSPEYSGPSFAVGARIIWMIAYCMIFCFVLGLEVLLAVGSLGYVLHRMN